MRRKLTIVVLLFLASVLALSLCACEPPQSPDKPNLPDKEGWKKITPVPEDVYKALLSGFTGEISNFTVDKLSKSDRSVSLNAELAVKINKHDFGAFAKLNYQDYNKPNAMASIQLTNSNVEDFDDMVVGIFIYEEKIFFAFGDTKFSFPFPVKNWEDSFPIKKKFDDSLNESVAMFLCSCLVVKEGEIDGKRRLNGNTEECEYKFELDLPASLKKIVSSGIKGKDGSAVPEIDQYNEIFTNIFGVTTDDILKDKFPKSSVTITFATSDAKVSAFTLKLSIKNEGGGKEKTLFSNEDIDLTVELNKFEIGPRRVTIPFVNDKDERSKYKEYASDAFRVRLNSKKSAENEGDPAKQYYVDLTAKILQDDATEDYFFAEYYAGEKKDVPEKGFYVYKDNAYCVEYTDGVPECRLKFPLKLNVMATKTLKNDEFDPIKKIDWLNAIAYVIGSLRVTHQEISFNYSRRFYDVIWVNFRQLVDHIDGLFAGDLKKDPVFDKFIKFMTDTPSQITFTYKGSESFIEVVSSNDDKLAKIEKNLTNIEPQKELKLASENVDPAGEETVSAPEEGQENSEEEPANAA